MLERTPGDRRGLTKNGGRGARAHSHTNLRRHGPTWRRRGAARGGGKY
jgi:hypothetical protein